MSIITYIAYTHTGCGIIFIGLYNMIERMSAMRKITYTCDRCGKMLSSKIAVKLNVSKQKGSDAVSKASFDFCTPCFLYMKSLFMNALKTDGQADAGKPEPETAFSGSPASAEKAVLQPVGNDDAETSKNSGELILGPLSQDERDKILHMFVKENLSPEEIAQRMNRLPRGIKRTINSATKNGDIARMREKIKCEETGLPAADTEETEEPDRDCGSGATNAGVIKDSYTAPPQTEVINGKRYDVGGILALAKAGWKPSVIAEERHYDEDIVAFIMEKYL